MGRRVDTDDLVDAHAVAELLGLAQRTSVSVYQQRYVDMPRPVIDLGTGRPRLWLRSELVSWMKRSGREGST
jgi:glutathione-regulated potassium-efflux system ancillary protein KefG